MSFFIISHFFFRKVTTENQTCICFDKKIMKKYNFVKPFLPVRANLLYKVDDETPCNIKLIFTSKVLCHPSTHIQYMYYRPSILLVVTFGVKLNSGR